MLTIVNLFVLATLIIVNLFVLVTLFVVNPLVLVMFAKVNKLFEMLILIKLYFRLMSVNPIVKIKYDITSRMLYLLFEIFIVAIFITDFSCVYDVQHASCKYFKFKYYHEVHMTFLISTKFFKCKYIFETFFKILSKVFYRHLHIYLTTINFLNFCLLFNISHSIKPNLFFVVVVILIPTKTAMLTGSKFHKHIKNCLYNINFIVLHML